MTRTGGSMEIAETVVDAGSFTEGELVDVVEVAVIML